MRPLPLSPALDRTEPRRDQGARGVAAALALLLVLGGCGRDDPEPSKTRIPPGLQTRFFPPPGWTWSSIRAPGAPPLRYGVGVQPKAVRGQVLILPGYGEPAEAWFETAGELIGAGYAVWILDLAGQGGSGRWLSPPDKGHLPSMQANLVAVKRMTTEVIRPGMGAPFVILGSGLGAQVALRSAAERLPGLDALVLSAPSLSDWPLSTPRPLQSEALAKGAVLVGLGGRYAPGEGAWRASLRDDAQRGSRAATPYVWMRANPELRLGGATWGWIKAYDESLKALRDPQTLARVTTPVLMLDDGRGSSRRICDRLPRCRYVRLPRGRAPHLAEDRTRELWRRQVEGFIDRQTSGYTLAAAPTRRATAP